MNTCSLTFQPNKPAIFNPLLSSRAFNFLYSIGHALGIYISSPCLVVAIKNFHVYEDWGGLIYALDLDFLYSLFWVGGLLQYNFTMLQLLFLWGL